MGELKRFEIFFEKHIGIGIRWENWNGAIRISIALPFITIGTFIGKENKI